MNDNATMGKIVENATFNRFALLAWETDYLRFLFKCTSFRNVVRSSRKKFWLHICALDRVENGTLLINEPEIK